MARKRHAAEELVAKLGQVDVLTAQGRQVSDAVRTMGVNGSNALSVASGGCFFLVIQIRETSFRQRRLFRFIVANRPPRLNVFAEFDAGGNQRFCQVIAPLEGSVANVTGFSQLILSSMSQTYWPAIREEFVRSALTSLAN